VVAGFAGIPAILGGGNWIEHFLHPVMADAHHALEEVFTAPVPPMEMTLMGASVLLAVLGIGLATLIYKMKPAIADTLASALAPVHRLLFRKYYVDELYNALFVRGLTLGGGEALFASDRYVIDGSGGSRFGPGLGVNGVAWIARDIVARLSDFWDRWIVDGAVNVTAAILDNMSYLFRAVQNGLVQTYALAMIMGILVLIGAGSWLLGLY
jgi:NADH-quinone oxidoreductase subunit L